MRGASYNDVFAFLWRSIQTMTCFLDCFGIRRNQPRPDFTNKGGIIREDEEECNVVDERENLIHQQLLQEAKFLKACGTLTEIPVEIRKTVLFAENLETSGVLEPHSVLESLAETSDEIQQEEILLENSERSDICILPDVLESSPETPEETQTTESSTEISDNSDAKIPCSRLRSSPYPTPRRITDEMQTPGTVFATNMKNLAQGNARIRSQYVYSVLNPIEDLDHPQESKAEKSAQYESPDHEAKYLSEKVDSSGKENIGNVSLSSWLKPPLANLESACKKPGIGRTPGPVNEPIIGLVAMHWNEQEDTSNLSPKWWDGNGIPNSTSKYKEDQKVNWHATPFEERLERALSEEISAPQRKSIDGLPILFEETEGHDTGESPTQSSYYPSAVASF